MIKNNGIQKIKSMELPISITPEVRTYSYYAAAMYHHGRG